MTTTKSKHPKHAETEVEVTPIDMQDVIDDTRQVVPDMSLTSEPVVHDTEPPTVGEVPLLSDVDAEIARLEQSGRPGAAAKLRAAAAGQKQPSAHQIWEGSIANRAKAT